MPVCDVEWCLRFALRWKEPTEHGLLSESSSIRGGSRLRANNVDSRIFSALQLCTVETARGVSALSCHPVMRQTHSLMHCFVPRWGPLDGRNFTPKKPWTFFADSCWCHGILGLGLVPNLIKAQKANILKSLCFYVPIWSPSQQPTIAFAPVMSLLITD